MDPRLVKRMIRLRRMALLVAVLLYLALTLAQLSLPGLHYDEAKEAGINAMEMLQRQDVHAFRSAGLQIGPVFLPLMVQDYIGALNVYLALPLLALFGVTVPALRLVGVLCGIGTIVMAWALGNNLSAVARQAPGATNSEGGRERDARIPEHAPGWTGAIAALLLAASPAFVFWSRQGIFVTNVVVTLAVATAWAGLCWLRTGRTRALYLMAVLAGLGLWAKLLFVWVLGALVAVALVGWLLSRWGRIDFGLQVLERPARHKLRTSLIASAFFLAALSPLLLFNLQTAGTFRSVFGNLGQSYYGVQNAAFLDNLSERLGQIATLLRGDFLWYLGGPFANSWALWLGALILGLALVGAVMEMRAGRTRTMLPVLLLALLFVLLLVVQSSFTVSGLFITHFAVIQPFVVLLAALAADCGWHIATGRWRAARVSTPARTSRGSRAIWAALMVSLAVALSVWFAADLQTSIRYHRALAESGGHVTHSDAIDRLAGWLDERQVKQPIALDWGIDAPMRYLTENRVEPLEIFGYDRMDAPDPGFEQRAAQFLPDLSRFYVARMPENTVFAGRREALQAAAAARGLDLTLVEAFYDRSGKTMFVVLRAEDGGG